MPLQLDLKYSNSYWNTTINWKIENDTLVSWDIPFDWKTIIALNQTKDWVILAMTGPQILTKPYITHSKIDWFRTRNKPEEVNIGLLKYNNSSLLILLHKAFTQCDMWTWYVLQILKKIEEIEEIDERNFEWTYKWFYSNFSNIDIRRSYWVLRVDEESLQNFTSGSNLEWYSWISEAKIIRV